MVDSLQEDVPCLHFFQEKADQRGDAATTRNRTQLDTAEEQDCRQTLLLAPVLFPADKAHKHVVWVECALCHHAHVLW